METPQNNALPDTSVLQDMLGQLRGLARARDLTDRQWAEQARVRRETVSRLRDRADCDLGTLVALAKPLDMRLVVEEFVPQRMPTVYGREEEERLLELCASPILDLRAWREAGPRYFMAGLAVMIASMSGTDRESLLMLGEALYPGMGSVGTFTAWLKKSPVRPSRFFPMLKQRIGKRAAALELAHV